MAGHTARRILKWFAWIVGILIAIPVLLVVFVLIAANTDPGRRKIESLTESLTGGMVQMQGLAGRFPDKLRIARIEVSNKAGPYIIVENVVLDWSPLQLVHRELVIDHLDAGHVDLKRLPESSSTSSSSSSNLPVRVVLREAHVDRLDIGAPVAGHAVALKANASATLDSMTEGQVRLTAERLDGEGHYALNGAVDATKVTAALTVREPADGLIAGVAGLPELGPIAIDANVDGPRDALVTTLDMHAGPLTAQANGTIDLEHEAANLSVAADAPAMNPRPGLAWQSIHLAATVSGPFTKPEANGTLHIAGLTASGGAVQEVNADISGNSGIVSLHAVLDGLRVPGPNPALLAGSPLTIDATIHLDQADRPAALTVRHRLMAVDATAQTAGALRAHADVTLPDLAPFAAIGHTDVQGRTHLIMGASQQDGATQLALTGTVGITGGTAPLPALVGDDARIDLTGAMRGQDIVVSRFSFDGKAIDLSASGSLTGGLTGQQTTGQTPGQVQGQVQGQAGTQPSGRLDADWAVRLADIGLLQPSVSGPVEAHGHASGPMEDLAVVADVTADLSGQGYRSGQVTAHVDAKGLPSHPSATLDAHGTLLDSPLNVALEASQQADGTHVTINQLDWKSMAGHGSATLPAGATIPIGHLELAMTRLADIAPLLGKAVSGSIKVTLDSDASKAHAVVDAANLALPGTASVDKAALNATIDDPTGSPSVDGTLTMEGVAAAGVSGGAKLTARGPADAVAVTLAANSPSLAGAAARLDTAGTLDAPGRTLSLSKLTADWKTISARLLAPVKVGFASGVSLDHLRLGVGQAELTASGHAGSTLDLTATVRNLPLDVAAVVSPSLAMDGVIAADAHLTGTSARPEGTVHLTASGVKMRGGPGEGLPPANLTATADLHGTSATIDSRVTAGKSYLALTGTAPLGTTGNLNLKTNGTLDLTMLDPIMAAQGRRVRGLVTLDATVAGTVAEPRATGTARLTNGDVQDFALGAHIAAINALVRAEGDTIRLVRLTGKAGEGTIGGSGTIGLAGDRPIELRLTASNARLLASDLLTVVLDANLYLRGALQGDLAVGGTVHVDRADIRVPEKLPAGVAVLPVTRPGQNPAPQPPATPPPADIALDLTVNAPQQVFVRGRGLDAELGGKIHVGGTLADPQPTGGLHLRRGTFSIIGQTLTFSEGTISFSGAGIANPSIHFVATSTTANLVATLTISGTAKDPKITLSSVPEAPQDEILAQLLFNTTTAKLSPLQLAQIAAALASLSGATSGLDPLESLRNTFGLDRLSVGTNSTGSPTLEAGKYVARGVYLGAKQSASGAGSQATVQIDIAKGLKLETTAGTGSSSATGATSRGDAASVGLTYQFEY
jgi:translocation and assembly module TamB